MRYRLRHFIIFLFIVVSLSFGLAQMGQAAPYGAGPYASCDYQTSCADNTTITAPNTGLQRASLIWSTIVGLIGVTAVSFVVIKYLRRAKRPN